MSSSDDLTPVPPNLRRRRKYQMRRRRYLPADALPHCGEDEAAEAEGSDPDASVSADAVVDQEIEKLKARLARLQADHDNFRKRVARERDEQAKYALENLMRELVIALDNFDRAMTHRAHSPEVDAFAQGLELTHQHLMATLQKHGLERIEATGRIFDPHLHEALAAEEVTGVPEGTVLDVLQEGYTLGGRVLRPALVKVSRGGPSPAPKNDVGE